MMSRSECVVFLLFPHRKKTVAAFITDSNSYTQILLNYSQVLEAPNRVLLLQLEVDKPCRRNI